MSCRLYNWSLLSRSQVNDFSKTKDVDLCNIMIKRSVSVILVTVVLKKINSIIFSFTNLIELSSENFKPFFFVKIMTHPNQLKVNSKRSSAFFSP